MVTNTFEILKRFSTMTKSQRYFIMYLILVLTIILLKCSICVNTLLQETQSTRFWIVSIEFLFKIYYYSGQVNVPVCSKEIKTTENTCQRWETICCISVFHPLKMSCKEDTGNISSNQTLLQLPSYNNFFQKKLIDQNSNIMVECILRVKTIISSKNLLIM